MSKYNFDLDLITENPVKIIVDKITPNSKILEFGPAHGRLTKYLNETMNCAVDIIELDQEAGEEASKFANKAFIGNIEGDIDSNKWFNNLKNEKYDYIIFADVLEHLRNPQDVLLRSRQLLKAQGSILLSVPNIAHNSVIIGLYNNEFEYNKIGLLDNTHIHFFSYYSLKRMIIECEFLSVMEKATFSRVGEIEIPYSYDNVPEEFAKELMKRPYGNLYSFVFEIKKREDVFTENCEQINALRLDQHSYYYMNCYIQNEESNFCESNKITKYVNANNNEFKFNLNEFKNINKIMIQPINSNALITIENISYVTSDGIKSTNYSTNAMDLGKNIYLFKCNQAIFVEGLENASELVINIKIIAYDLQDLNYIYDALFSMIEEKKSYIESLVNVIAEKDKYSEALANVILDKDKYNETLTNVITDKDDYIEKLKNVLEDKNKYTDNLEILIKEKDEYNESISKLVNEGELQLEKKANSLNELQKSHDEITLK